MRVKAFVCMALLGLVNIAGAQEATQILQTPGASKVKDASSYGIGYDIGMNIASGGIAAEQPT